MSDWTLWTYIAPPTFITFVVYITAMLAIGFWAYRMTSNLSDYVLGGRKLGSTVTALSASASDMSGWLLLGLPGAVYAAGANQIWLPLGLVIGAYLNWLLVSSRLRDYTYEFGDSITLPDYFENRFKDKSRLLRLFSALVILVFFTFYVSSGLVAGAILFKNSFGFSYETALYVSVFVIVLYTFLGGFIAVSWTDCIQGILMLLALLVVPYVAIQEIGGWDVMIAKAQDFNSGVLDMHHDLTTMGIVSLMAWGLGFFGQPHILARFMAIKTPEELPKARRIAMSWMILVLVGAMLTGFAGFVYYSETPLQNSETVFIHLSQVLFNPWVAGIMLAAILSAIMSTIDSQLIVCSSAITEDFYKAFFRRFASDKELVLVGRVAVLMIAAIATWVALDPKSNVLNLVGYAWAGFGAAFGPVILLSLFWKRMTRNGALAGMVVGTLAVIIWKELDSHEIFKLYEIVPGFIFNVVTIVVVSLMGEKPEHIA